MSLFTHTEVCAGCRHSLWYENRHLGDIFVACEQGREKRVDSATGVCPHKDMSCEGRAVNRGDAYD